MPKPTMASTATPPTVPPTMAPIGVDDGALVSVGGAVDVVCEEVVVDVGFDVSLCEVDAVVVLAELVDCDVEDEELWVDAVLKPAQGEKTWPVCPAYVVYNDCVPNTLVESQYKACTSTVWNSTRLQ
jgi:hypothetical protein